MSETYERDFYAWANEQAALLRAGRLAEADIAHIDAEIGSMGKTEKRALVSQLTVLLLHLLKWQFQPSRRGAIWEATIKIQRNGLEDHLADNSSLKALLDPSMRRPYQDAAIEAAAETGLPEKHFSSLRPWASDQIMDRSFWPD